MVDYSKVYEAFVIYAADRNQGAWCDLWILCRRRMGRLVGSRLYKLGIQQESVDCIIDDAVIELMELMRGATDIDESWISSRFWFSYLHSYKRYVRARAKDKKLDGVIAAMNKKQIIPENFM